ncbi:MAG: SAM-dependent methyltransferase [Ancalomicrobiaceae bacterium]|nr:SAM-dependent methyltransferase [Ancalomicrobiaceae bacterium]
MGEFELSEMVSQAGEAGASGGIRPGEEAASWDGRIDAGLIFIGRIRTPWTVLSECPRHGRPDGPLCRIEVFDVWAPALAGVDVGAMVEVFYWLHRSRRDLLLQTPRHDGVTHGTFSLRSPIRPNPIGTSIVRLERREGTTLFARGLDCLDGTPLVDLKPDRSEFIPRALPTPGDFQVGEP